MKKFLNTLPPLIVMLIWGLHLIFPWQFLQHKVWTLFGYIIPIYYFFIVLPMLGAAVLFLSFKRDWTKWELIWWLLPLICLPGILHSDDRIWSVRQCLSWVIRGIIPGGIILGADRKNTIVLLTCWIYPIIIIASLLGIREVYYDSNPLLDFYLPTIRLNMSQSDKNPFYRPLYPQYANTWARRPGGTQGNRSAYAATLIGFLPLGLWLLKYKKNSIVMHFLAVGALLSIIIMASVRAVWLSALLIIALMPLLGMQRKLQETAKMIMGILLCLGLFLSWPKTRGLLLPRFHSFHMTEPSIRERLAVLGTARALEGQWFSGAGFGQFPIACRTYYPKGMIWNNTPDNEYLRWAIENGATGFLLLSSFLIGFVIAAWKKIQLIDDIQQSDLFKSLLVGWISIAATFLFFDGFYWGACNMTFWIFLGLLSTHLNSSHQN